MIAQGERRGDLGYGIGRRWQRTSVVVNRASGTVGEDVRVRELAAVVDRGAADERDRVDGNHDFLIDTCPVPSGCPGILEAENWTRFRNELI